MEKFWYSLYGLLRWLPVCGRRIRRTEWEVFRYLPMDAYGTGIHTMQCCFFNFLAGFGFFLLGWILAGTRAVYLLADLVIAWAAGRNRFRNWKRKQEVRLIGQLSAFLEELRYAYYRSKDAEDAIYEAWTEAGEELKLHLAVMEESFFTEGMPEAYQDRMPNRFYTTFLAICQSVIRYGDYEEEGKSFFLSDLEDLQQSMNQELLKWERERSVFGGLFPILSLPVLFLPLMERWSLGQVPELAPFYQGGQGSLVRLAVYTVTGVLLYLLRFLKEGAGNRTEFGRREEAGGEEPEETRQEEEREETEEERVGERRDERKREGKNVEIEKKQGGGKREGRSGGYQKGAEEERTGRRTEERKDGNRKEEGKEGESGRGADVEVFLLHLAGTWCRREGKLGRKTAQLLHLIFPGSSLFLFYLCRLFWLAGTGGFGLLWCLYYRTSVVYGLLWVPAAVFASFLPYLSLVFGALLYGSGVEEEILQYRTILLLLSRVPHMNVEVLLEWMERFGYYFRPVLTECIDQYGSTEEAALEELKAKQDFPDFGRLVEDLAAADRVGVKEAFRDLVIQREFWMQKSRQTQETGLKQKEIWTQAAAYLPFGVSVFCYLVLPFLYQGMKSLLGFMEWTS